MATTMRAAVLNEARGRLAIEELSADDPIAGEALVRVVATGVCHSDLHLIEGTYPIEYPAVLGHEVAGVVEAVGPGVTTVAPGDRVIAAFVQPCGHCRYCDSGRPNLCQTPTTNRAEDRPKISRNGDPVATMTNVGGFAQYALTPASGLVPVPHGIGLDVAALVGCSVMTGYGAVVNTAGVEPGSSVAVIGAGGVGLNIVQSARLAGAAQIIAVDMVEHKLKAARDFGATEAIDASDGDAVKAVKQISGGGVDYAFEAIGLTQTARQAYDMTARGGTAVVVGMVPPREAIEVPGVIWLQEKTLKGSFYGSARFHTDIPRILELYRQGRLDLDRLVTRRWPLEQVNEAFDAMRSGEGTRSVLEIGAE